MSCQSAHTGCSGAQALATEQQHEENCSYALGPYPDEVIMLALDRILYYSGVTKIKHLLQMANFGTSSQLVPPVSISTPTPPSAPCKVSCGTSTCNLIGKIDVSKYNSSNSSLSHFTSAKTGKSIKGLTPSLRSQTVNVSNLRPRTPHVDFANPVVDNRLPAGPSFSTSVKQSLSACSIACRRLKVKLSATAQNKDQRWVWTRLVSSANGCKVYEVYQNSQSDKKPWKSCDPKQQPVVVFLVMPSGYVMVFETVSRSLL
ncbi:uncharacterized protein LOC132793451 [Drosophila nasuta]|uniref:uncharacterized protein LOC132793451 n=1 Tax=Drosophila nasuta TaxID=42062 RepID=UPI00295E6818|nr:uncharacterized protein LOC132793451 [Drosophila nasuta]